VTDFAALQRRLPPVWRLNQPPGGPEHVRIVLPSYNVGPSALAAYAPRVPSLEHRFLVDVLEAARVEGCTVLLVLSRAPEPGVLDYLVSLLPSGERDRIRGRIRTVVVPGSTYRPLSARLLERRDLLDQIRAIVGDRPAMIEPWNVTDDEVAIANALQVPLDGTPPHLWPIAFKSAGRKLLTAAGVPVAPGHEDVQTPDEVLAAIRLLRAENPDLRSVVVKLDNSVAGVGNHQVHLREPDGSPSPEAVVEARVAAMPDWYVEEMALGAVVETYIAGDRWSSPSVQVQITPDGRAEVLATHEQLLGGENGQVYLGCRFPARRQYATRLTSYGRQVGEELAARGALGMLSVDFAAVRDRGEGWRLYALEVNLRRGGTTPPIVVLSSLLPGRYDGHGRWRLPDGSARFYWATDNLVDERWTGLPAAEVIEGVRRAGLAFDPASGTGVVLHTLTGLAIDGRLSLVAIGRTLHEAERMFGAVQPVVDRISEAWTARGTGRGLPVAADVTALSTT
jgi:hypothetical protein